MKAKQGIYSNAENCLVLTNPLPVCDAFTTNAATAGVSRLSVEPAVFSNARGLGQYEKFTQSSLYIVKDKGQVKSFLPHGK